MEYNLLVTVYVMLAGGWQTSAYFSDPMTLFDCVRQVPMMEQHYILQQQETFGEHLQQRPIAFGSCVHKDQLAEMAGRIAAQHALANSEGI